MWVTEASRKSTPADPTFPNDRSPIVTLSDLSIILLLLVFCCKQQVSDSHHLAGGSQRRRTAATAARHPWSSRRWPAAGGSWRRRTAATVARNLRSSHRWESCLGKIAEVVSRCLPRGFYLRVSFSWLSIISSLQSAERSCELMTRNCRFLPNL